MGIIPNSELDGGVRALYAVTDAVFLADVVAQFGMCVPRSVDRPLEDWAHPATSALGLLVFRLLHLRWGPRRPCHLYTGTSAPQPH